jgi:tetratricopeptide (TPR) repeat protein
LFKVVGARHGVPYRTFTVKEDFTMRQKSEIAFLLVGLIVVGILAVPTAMAQNAAPPSLKEQLEAQYTLSKVFTDGTIKDPGTVLVIQQQGIQGVPLTDAGMPTARCKDGVLHKPSAGSSFGASLVAAMANPNSETSGQVTRPFPVGEKVYISALDVNLKKDRITFTIAECATCNGADPSSAYKAAVSFEFAKGSLAGMSVPDVEDAIAKVFALDTATTEAQPAQPGTQAEQPAAAPAQGLTNDDIIKMVQVKLGDSVIIAKIKSSACAFDTSVDGLSKLKQADVSDAVLQAMLEVAGQQPPPPPPPPTPPPVETPSAPACGDYASCLASGNAALSARQWDQSLTDLQKASTFEPTKPEAWAEMGKAYVATGQFRDAVAMWDKALGLGGTLTFGVWHYGGLHGYQRGSFRLGAKEVSFTLADQERVFSVAPTEVSSVKSHRAPLTKNWTFGMKAGGRNYWFAFVPLGVECKSPVTCNDPAGYNQAEAVSNYVAQTIGKLAPGSLGK